MSVSTVDHGIVLSQPQSGL